MASKGWFEIKRQKRGRISSKKEKRRKGRHGKVRIKAKEKMVKVYVCIYIILYIFRDSATKFIVTGFSSHQVLLAPINIH
jgi:hypothetical protein